MTNDPEPTTNGETEDRDTERKTAKKKKFNVKDLNEFNIDTNTPNSKKDKAVSTIFISELILIIIL
jgi:hypothetical protein